MPSRSDESDRRILRALAADGRARLAELAESTGLSTSAVQLRVRKLEQNGSIRRYGAVIDERAVGLGLSSFIEITPFDPAQPDDAPERLRGVSGIESCYSVAGVASYVLLVRVPDTEALEVLVQRIRTVAQVSTRTLVVLSTPFEYRVPQQ